MKKNNFFRRESKPSFYQGRVAYKPLLKFADGGNITFEQYENSDYADDAETLIIDGIEFTLTDGVWKDASGNNVNTWRLGKAKIKDQETLDKYTGEGENDESNIIASEDENITVDDTEEVDPGVETEEVEIEDEDGSIVKVDEEDVTTNADEALKGNYTQAGYTRDGRPIYYSDKDVNKIVFEIEDKLKAQKQILSQLYN